MFAKRSLLANKEGGAALEFALLAPPLIAMLFGTFQLGWAMNSASIVHDALMTQSRALAFNANMTNQQLQTAVRSQVAGLTDRDVTVTIDHQVVNGVNSAVATATYTASIQVPLLGSYPVSFNSTVTVPMLQV